MIRITHIVLIGSLAVIMCILSFKSTEAAKHKKVIIHVPYKVHTIHHHTYKTVPVVHYFDSHDAPKKSKSRSYYPDDDYDYYEED